MTIKLIQEAEKIPDNFTGIAEYSSGSKEWYQNGKRHREDGPAIEYFNGTKCWYQNGKWHRLDGPACEYSNGTKEYWINGNFFQYQESWQKEVDKINGKNLSNTHSCHGKEVIIEGKTYILQMKE
jgi:hypothetical protein